MKQRKRRAAKTKPKRKRPYQTPKLGIYGDLLRLTQVKLGTMNDGGGKPMTKASGGNA